MQCSICNGTFSRKDSLKRHLLNVHGVQEEDDSVSTKEKTFACSQCDAKFTEKSNLNRHMKNKHNDKVKSKDEKTTTATVLPFDLTQHENNDRFLCSICNLPFTCKESRNDHFKNVHLTQKQFKCKNCSKSFKSKVNKNLHENHC